MKNIKFLVALVTVSFALTYCSPKYGCPSDGKNVGAEKLLDGSSTKKQPKFKH